MASGDRPLAPSFDVVATDSPGFGRCAPLPPDVEPDIDAYADAFIAFFAEQGLGRPHVAGNSMGGAIVLELVRRGRRGVGHGDLARGFLDGEGADGSPSSR